MNNQGWIFSKNKDLIFFLGTLCVSYLLCAIAFKFKFNEFILAPAWVYIWLHIIIDGSHVFGTLYRVYFDKNEVLSKPLLYIGTPICVFLWGWYIYFKSPTLATSLLAYFAIFHFIRQQYGWMVISANKSKSQNKTLDKLAIYNATAVPILYWILNPTKYGWFEPGDIIPINLDKNYSRALLIGHFLFYLYYFFKEYQTIKNSKTVPWGKYLILFCSWCTWFSALVILRTHITGLILFALNHGVQYLVLIYEYVKKKNQFQIVKKKIWPILFYLSLASIAAVEIMNTPKLMLLGQYSFFLNLGFPEHSWNSVAWGIIIIPQVTHYILDGYVWKQNKQNPELNMLVGGR